MSKNARPGAIVLAIGQKKNGVKLFGQTNLLSNLGNPHAKSRSGARKENITRPTV